MNIRIGQRSDLYNAIVSSPLGVPLCSTLDGRPLSEVSLGRRTEDMRDMEEALRHSSVRVCENNSGQEGFWEFMEIVSRVAELLSCPRSAVKWTGRPEGVAEVRRADFGTLL